MGCGQLLQVSKKGDKSGKTTSILYIAGSHHLMVPLVNRQSNVVLRHLTSVVRLPPVFVINDPSSPRALPEPQNGLKILPAECRNPDSYLHRRGIDLQRTANVSWVVVAPSAS